jgi:hypothetical protein
MISILLHIVLPSIRLLSEALVESQSVTAKSPSASDRSSSQDPGEEVLKEVLETSSLSYQAKTSNSVFFTNGYNSAGEDEETKETCAHDSTSNHLDSAGPGPGPTPTPSPSASIQLPEGVLNRALSNVSLSKEMKIVPVVQCINALSKVLYRHLFIID